MFRRFCEKKSIKNKWAVLHLLQQVSFDANKDTSFGTAAPFQLPSFDTSRIESQNSSLLSNSKMLPVKQQPFTSLQQPLFASQQQQSMNSTPFVMNPSLGSTSIVTSVSDELLLRDILFAFQGIDGKYVYYDAKSDHYQVKSEYTVPRVTRDCVCKLCELGWLYKKVKRFVDGIMNQSLPEYPQGIVIQSFAAAVHQEVAEFLKLIAILQAQVQSNQKNMGTPGLSLRSLLVWTLEPREKLKLLAILIDAIAGSKGGHLIATVYSYMNHGDPSVQQATHELMKHVMS